MTAPAPDTPRHAAPPAPTGPPTSHRQTVVIALLTAGLLWWAFRDIDPARAWSAVVAADWWWIVLATVVTVQTYVLRAIRWQVLLEPLGGASFRAAFRTTVIGFAANLLLPARAGEVLRPYLLSRTEPIGAASAFATVVIERLLDLVTVLLLFGVAMRFSGVEVGSTVAGIGAASAAASVVALLVLAVLAGHPERLGRWTDRIARRLPGKAARVLGELVRTLAVGLRVMRSPGHLAVAMLWSVPLWLSLALGIMLTSWAFGLSMSFLGSFLVIGFLTVGVMAPTPGAVGGFHTMYKEAATRYFAASADAALAAGTILHLVSFIPVTLLGLFYMWQDGLSLGRLRGLRQDAEAAEHPSPRGTGGDAL
jgi:uncharacterized protein (TIRG00374 family)